MFMKMASPEIVQVGEFGIGAGHEQRHDHAAGRGEQRRKYEDHELRPPDIDTNEARRVALSRIIRSV